MRELSKKNPLYLPKWRQKELEYFARQYPDWQKELSNISYFNEQGKEHVDGGDVADPTFKLVDRREQLKDKIDMVETAAHEATDLFDDYIIQAATEDCTYEELRYHRNMYCSRNAFYTFLRRFYFILSDMRG